MKKTKKYKNTKIKENSFNFVTAGSEKNKQQQQQNV